MRNIDMQPDAAASISGGPDAPRLHGEARFYQLPMSVLIEVIVSGLPGDTKTGFFAFHIHEGKSCEGLEFADTGGHYNPYDTQHPDHAGDLPPLMLCNGGAYMSVSTDRFRVSDIVGRTVVIHHGSDDFTSQPAGNSGTKIGCGVIRRYKMYKY